MCNVCAKGSRKTHRCFLLAAHALLFHLAMRSLTLQAPHPRNVNTFLAPERALGQGGGRAVVRLEEPSPPSLPPPSVQEPALLISSSVAMVNIFPWLPPSQGQLFSSTLGNTLAQTKPCLQQTGSGQALVTNHGDQCPSAAPSLPAPFPPGL